jgi:hypothetical protein
MNSDESIKWAISNNLSLLNAQLYRLNPKKQIANSADTVCFRKIRTANKRELEICLMFLYFINQLGE